ncbi:MAG: hypothetical protein HYV95_06285 [Opitutae bacterium]|nr:hypothetical protein [Opitutae bacterium]
MHVVLAFTLIEIGIAIVIIAVAAAILFSIFSDAKDKLNQTQQTTYTSGWQSSPATIPAAPATGTFTYKVNQQTGSQPVQPAPDRSVLFTFELSSSGSGELVSVSSSGSPFNIPATTPPTLAFTGLSDTYGLIQVVVKLEQGMSGKLTASDPKTGKADPPISFTAQ